MQMAIAQIPGMEMTGTENRIRNQGRGGLARSAIIRVPSMTIGLATPGNPSGVIAMPRATTCGLANTSSTRLIGPAGTPTASSALDSAA